MNNAIGLVGVMLFFAGSAFFVFLTLIFALKDKKVIAPIIMLAICFTAGLIMMIAGNVIYIHPDYTQVEQVAKTEKTETPKKEEAKEEESGGTYGQESLDIDSENIKKFDYEVSGNKVVLQKYNGRKKTLYIESSYKIDGQTYETDLSELSLMSSKPTFLILREGIENINKSAFNCSNLESVYFPKTIKVVYDAALDYLHPDEGEKIQIYYAGTEDEWDNIFQEYQRQTIEEALNSSDIPEEQGAAVGTSVAEKFNEYLGEYDSSDYEFHFSVSENDLNNLIKEK